MKKFSKAKPFAALTLALALLLNTAGVLPAAAQAE